MKLESQQEFYGNFPNMFNHQNPPVRGGFWGFECGEGWKNLLWDLCMDLLPYVDTDFKVLQVKEKFGTLRFYAHGGTQQARDLIDKAEVESATTCEVCGSKTGQLRGGGWMRTLCNHCHSNNLRP